ncbi:DUF2726 domain-containing protein [Tropicimonas sp. S265A]|uniref:DUF2726 domain-containing protein n=1 Tax=Tropicimonas sp. S265A TaxID=3415134 RepID=UPI003C7E0422
MFEFILLTLVALGLAVFLTRPKKRPRKKPSRSRQRKHDATTGGAQDPSGILQAAQIDARPLFGSDERRVLCALLDWERQHPDAYMVLRKVALSDMFRLSNTGSRSAWDSARTCFDTRHVDFLIVDADGWPVLAIDYHETGHYERGAGRRDEVKALIFKQAGVTLTQIDKHTALPRFLDDIDAMLTTRLEGLA